MRFRLISNNAKTARGIRRGILTDLAKAALFATDEAARLGRGDIQVAMRAGRLGRLSGAVRYSSDQRKRRSPRVTAQGAPVQPWRAGSIVFSSDGSDRTSGAFEAYSQGAIIRPKGGRRWLAFPTKAIPKKVGRLKMTPALYNASGLVRSIGKLQFVRGPSAGVAYLVARNVSVRSVTGSGARALGARGGAGSGRSKKQFVVAFILIRATARQKRFDPMQIMQRRARNVPSRIAAYLNGSARGGGAVRGPVLFSSGGRASGSFIPVTRA